MALHTRSVLCRKIPLKRPEISPPVERGARLLLQPHCTQGLASPRTFSDKPKSVVGGEWTGRAGGGGGGRGLSKRKKKKKGGIIKNRRSVRSTNGTIRFQSMRRH